MQRNESDNGRLSDKAERIVALTRMFDAYGQTPTTSRLEMYDETIPPCSPSQLAEGIRDAMREAQDFPPGPGTLTRCVRAVARTRPGDPTGDWRFAGQRNERTIPAAQSAGALLAGAAARTPGMARIFARAREIRAAGVVPPDLWGRFASEVIAELEFDPRAEVSAEMRKCMEHARKWREGRGIDADGKPSSKDVSHGLPL